MHPEEQLSISRQAESGISIAGISLVGGAIQKLILGGKPVISTDNIESPESMFFGSLLAPWPNRLAAANYTFRGQKYQAPILDIDGNSNHGLIYDRELQVLSVSEDSLKLGYQFGKDACYPFDLNLEVQYQILDGELEVVAVATNEGEDAPFAIGFHPYFLVGEKFLLEAEFTKHIQVDQKMIPISEETVAGLSYSGGPMDDCFYGAKSVKLITTTYQLEMRLDSGYEYFMLYRPDPNLGESLLAVEPMSASANAFNSKIEEIVLRSGESREYSFSIRTL